MALQGKTQMINCYEYSVMGETRICQFYYNINSEEPESMDMGRSVLDMVKYKENRAQVIKDQASFEEAAFKFQDELIAQKNADVKGEEK